MKLFILALTCLTIGIWCKSEPKADPKCPGIHVNGKLHRKHVIMNGLNRPYQLAMYNHEHKIFFSYNEGEDSEDKFGIAYVKIDDTIPTNITGTENGFAIAIDEHDKMVYFGGSKGIFAHNLTGSHGLKHIVKDKDIWDMFYHNGNLYFIDYPPQRLHKYNIKENVTTLVEHIHEKLYQFVIDGDNATFIATKKGLFEALHNGTRIPFAGPKVFRAIEVNHAGVAHFGSKSGIYVAHKQNRTLIEIAKVKNIFGLAFDSKNNIIYSNPHEIIKLEPHDCK